MKTLFNNILYQIFKAPIIGVLGIWMGVGIANDVNITIPLLSLMTATVIVLIEVVYFYTKK